MKINGNKTHIGLLLGAILGLLVANVESISIESSWVQSLFTLIGLLTGVSYRHAIAKGK